MDDARGRPPIVDPEVLKERKAEQERISEMKRQAALVGTKSPNFHPARAEDHTRRQARLDKQAAEADARRAVLPLTVHGPNDHARRVKQKLIDLRVQYPKIEASVLEPPPRAAALTTPLPTPEHCAACGARETYPYTFDPLRTRIFLWLCSRCASAWDA